MSLWISLCACEYFYVGTGLVLVVPVKENLNVYIWAHSVFALVISSAWWYFCYTCVSLVFLSFSNSKNKHGCDTCRCKKCPELPCDKSCPVGFQQDELGCLICQCRGKLLFSIAWSVKLSINNFIDFSCYLNQYTPAIMASYTSVFNTWCVTHSQYTCISIYMSNNNVHSRYYKEFNL